MYAIRSYYVIQWVANRLRPQVDRLLINANRNLASYAALGYPVISDKIADLPGPARFTFTPVRRYTTIMKRSDNAPRVDRRNNFV